jgi:hypothetical protein
MAPFQGVKEFCSFSKPLKFKVSITGTKVIITRIYNDNTRQVNGIIKNGKLNTNDPALKRFVLQENIIYLPVLRLVLIILRGATIFNINFVVKESFFLKENSKSFITNKHILIWQEHFLFFSLHCSSLPVPIKAIMK